jgi:hypothetical protein
MAKRYSNGSKVKDQSDSVNEKESQENEEHMRRYVLEHSLLNRGYVSKSVGSTGFCVLGGKLQRRQAF